MPALRQSRRQHASVKEQRTASAGVSASAIYRIDVSKVYPPLPFARRLTRALEIHPQDVAGDAAERPSCGDLPERAAHE